MVTAIKGLKSHYFRHLKYYNLITNSLKWINWIIQCQRRQHQCIISFGVSTAYSKRIVVKFQNLVLSLMETIVIGKNSNNWSWPFYFYFTTSGLKKWISFKQVHLLITDCTDENILWLMKSHIIPYDCFYQAGTVLSEIIRHDQLQISS